MAVITINSSVTTGLDKEFDTITTIEIPEENAYRGGFGKLYQCVKINTKAPKDSQLIKLFFETDSNNINTVRKLQHKLKIKHEELITKGTSLLETYPALLAVPLFSFEGTLNGERVVGYSAYNLSDKGFIDFKSILDEEDLYDDFYNVFKLKEKYILAYHLIKALNFLWSIGYIHADIKDDAIFINAKTNTCALIDFDSGAVFDPTNKTDDKPTTIGTIQDWLAPEILDQIGKSVKDLNAIRVNVFTDTWSVAMALFCIFMGCHPFNFLSEISKKKFREYFDNYNWPDVEQGNSMEPILQYYQKVVPDEIKQAFAITFNQGYIDPAMRYSYLQWEQAFMSIQEPPKIISFVPENYVIEQKENIILKWEVTGADSVFLNGHNVTNQNEYSVSPTRNTTYELKAINGFGKEVCKTSSIKISDKPPVIQNFTYKVVNKIKNQFQLIWNVENAHRIFLNPGIGEVTQQESHTIHATGTYVLIAESYFGAKAEKTLVVSGLFNASPDNTLFVANPPNSIFNDLE